MSAADFIPAKPSLKAMRLAARTCKGCDLWRRATQTVFGEGPARARVVIVGEQPGDAEDREGRPFVGPAGLLLDRALEEAGISRSEVFLTTSGGQPSGKHRQVSHEGAHRRVTLVVGTGPKYRRRVDRREHQRCDGGLDQAPAG